MKQVMGNVIVGQSGGPTAVINSSLAGVFKTAKDRGAKKYMVCCTAFRDCWRNGWLICQNISAVIWILIC